MTASPSFFTRVSFRQQLFLICSAGVVGLALIASLSAAWWTSQRITAIHLRHGLEITGTLARQSVLALLYQSAANAEKAVETTLAFPAVTHVLIVDREGRPLLQRGDTPAPPPSSLRERTPHLYQDGPDAWSFIAPVFLDDEDEERPFTRPAQENELLGHAIIVMEKRTLHEVRRGLFLNNLTIALVVTLIVVWGLHVSISRLLRPLDELARVMEEVASPWPDPRMQPKGPPEVLKIAAAYHRMRETIAERDRQLRHHNQQLEEEVALRTAELVQARDDALHSSRLKSEFIANMSHELRTPLQAIIGFSDVVREALVDQGLETYTEDMDSVLQNAQHLLAQINEILDFAKVDAGRMRLELAETDLTELARQVVKTVEPAMERQGNRLVLVLETADKAVVDGRKLRQILLNLLSNAAKFTQRGEVTLTVTATAAALSCQVRDTGIGIAPEHHREIFSPFRQVDGSLTRSFQGAGLGLALSRRFCRLMGGDISVESALGEGSCFTVHIPLPISMPPS